MSFEQHKTFDIKIPVLLKVIVSVSLRVIREWLCHYSKYLHLLLEGKVDKRYPLTSKVDRTNEAGFPWLVSDASARGERGQSTAPRME